MASSPESSSELPPQHAGGKPRGFFQQWMRQPQTTWARKAIFQLHLWSGLILGLYIVVVCVSGSALVFRIDIYNALEDWDKHPVFAQKGAIIRAIYSILAWMENLHGRLLLGANGLMVNAIGGFLTAAVCVTGLVIWWPGIARWRRALIVTRGVGWKRFNFDLHSAVGFWTFGILFIWGMTGGYFVFPEPFRAIINYYTPINPPLLPQAAPQARAVNPAPPSTTSKAGAAPVKTAPPNSAAVQSAASSPSPAPFPRRRRRPLTKGGRILQWFSLLHYGNFAGWKVKTLWFLLGLSPAILFGTAIVMWWNRVLSSMFRQWRRGWTEAPATVAPPELDWERE